MADKRRRFDTAAERWEGVGPYYAMFPNRFANLVIRKYSSLGDTVLDPFAGRGTAVFSAAALGRHGLGIEINPVGWVYTKTKLRPAPMENVEQRLLQILQASKHYAEKSRSLPKFYSSCYSFDVLRFLLAARANLDWRRNAQDRTLMTFLLVYLHGKEGQALSNQMRQTKAMSPQYAIRWWEKNGKKPPKIDVEEFLLKRIRWRYAKGVVKSNGSSVYLGNSVKLLPRLRQRLRLKESMKAELMLTSPPYCGVTNYHYDQWLRLWLLGFETSAFPAKEPFRGRFVNRFNYLKLLRNVFSEAATILSTTATVYVRTGSDSFTLQATKIALNEAFPRKSLLIRRRPFLKPTQTHLFGDRTEKDGEIDLILLPS